MSTAARLVKLVEGLDADGVLSATKGGTGNTTGGGTSSPTISQIAYSGDDTAANPAGGQTITLTGTNFAQGAKVLINTTQVSVVTVVSATQITFTAPALAAGSYILYVVNTNGSTAIAVPGIQVSGTPAWTTAAGTLGTVYETAPVSATVAATSDSAVSYSLASGTLPTGATLAANGTISGTSVLTNSSTTYSFTIKATDAENQDTDRSFSLTINPDVVSWSSPANSATLTGAPGVAYSSALVATSAAGKSITYSADALPAGLSISGATITGTPTTAGTSSSTLTATAATTNRTAQVTISWTITVAADTYFPYTTLLLNSEPTATPFLADASTNNFAVTAFGDTKPNNFNPYTPGYYSNYFDGSSGSLASPQNATFNLSTGNWTIEAWFNSSSIMGQSARYITITPSAGAVYGVLPGNNAFVLNQFGTNSPITTSIVPTLNAWQHIALVKSGSTTTLYINGAAGGSAAVPWVNADTTIFFGGNSGSYAADYTGYISNARVVKGTAVYTANFTPPTQPLTAIANTALLTCQSNRFIDNSTNNFTLTKVGNPKISGFIPFVPDASYATYGSTYFDGTGDYLSTSASLNLGTNSFTVEFWTYWSTHASYAGLVSTSGGTSGQLQIIFNGTADTLRIDIGGTQWITSYTLPSNTWTHLAVVRSGSGVTLYANGVSVATTTNSSSVDASNLRVGLEKDSGVFYTGYISDLRVVNGTAVYTTAFTPPAAPLTAVSGTSLLTCQTNQPVNNQTFLDNSTNAFPISRTGNTTQGSFSPYGANWSNYFAGDTNDYLTVSAASSQLNLPGDFTVECWIYDTGSGGLGQFAWSTSGGFACGINAVDGGSTRKLDWRASGSAPVWGVTAITQNTWHHVAYVRSGSAFRMFLNGKLEYYNANLTTAYSSTSTNIGAKGGEAGYAFKGYISNFRVVKGTAVYTTSSTSVGTQVFTPDTTVLTAITNTALLTCQNASLVDHSLNALAITKTGDISVQKFNPFATVTQTPNTHSTYFDGTGDYLTLAGNAAFSVGAGDYTVETWIYPTAVGSNKFLFGFGQNSGSLNISIGPNTANKLCVFRAGIAFDLESTANIVANVWTHIAITKLSGTTTIWINGQSSGTSATAYTYADASTTVTSIGTRPSLTTEYFVGYMSNLRLVKGTAVYTANFTPATTPLTATTNTSLLTCQSPTLTDNSVNQFTITTFGDAKPRQQNPFGSTTSSTQDYTPTTFGGSGYFDGSGDYLTCTGAISLTGAFTAQGWFYNTSTSGQQQSLFSFNSTSGSYGSLRVDCDQGNVQFNFSATLSTNGSSWATILSTNNAYVKNIWNHFAVTRDSANLVKVFINGVQIASGTLAGALYSTSTTHAIGCNGLPGAATNPFIGYINDLQLVNGTALYTANFAPPTQPLTATTNTTLLLNMDKAAIADKSGKVVLECVGDTKISTAVKKYGSSSMYFDGSGDNLTLSSVVRPSIGTGDFTVELWAYHLNTSAYSGYYWGGSSGLVLRRTDGNKLELSHDGVASIVVSTANIPANQWTHIAATRSGGAVKIFIDGVVAGTVTYATSIVGTTAPTVGSISAVAGYYMNGYIDDLRVTNGVARYTTTFTPPSQALLTK